MPRPQTVSDEDLVLATSRMIERLGAGRVTLADVAEEAGISPAVLVQRFGSKHGLLLAVARRARAGIGDAFAAADARPGSRLDALVDLLSGFVAGIESPEVLGNHVSFLHLDLVDPELREQAQQQARAVERGVGKLLAAARDAGELVDTDVRRLATALHSTYNGALITWALAGKGKLSGWVRRELRFALTPYTPA
jgi:AcrR family transcriptional regulator